MKDKAPPRTQPMCSTCARALRDGGFRVKFARTAQLYITDCSVCGKRLPVHDGVLMGGRRRKQKNIS